MSLIAIQTALHISHNDNMNTLSSLLIYNIFSKFIQTFMQSFGTITFYNFIKRTQLAVKSKIRSSHAIFKLVMYRKMFDNAGKSLRIIRLTKLKANPYC